MPKSRRKSKSRNRSRNRGIPPVVNQKTLFVLYTLTSNDSWTYRKFPKGWFWVGSGSTFPLESKQRPKFTREEQFSGPAETKQDMIDFLNQTFQKLQEKNNLLNLYFLITNKNE